MLRVLSVQSASRRADAQRLALQHPSLGMKGSVELLDLSINTAHRQSVQFLWAQMRSNMLLVVLQLFTWTSDCWC